MDNKSVQGVLDVSMDKIKGMVDANTVVGAPIVTGDGTTLLPVSKVSYGFAAGGSDLPSKSPKDVFGGGSGAGITVTPVAFIVISPIGEVTSLSIVSKPDSGDRIVNLVPELVDKVAGLFKKDKKDKKKEKEAEPEET